MGFLLLNLALAGSLEFAMAAIWLIYHAVNYLLSAIFRNLIRELGEELRPVASRG